MDSAKLNLRFIKLARPVASTTQRVLKVLDSPMGSADKHEGVVIRDESIAKVPFKITGKFILGGMVSDF